MKAKLEIELDTETIKLLEAKYGRKLTEEEKQDKLTDMMLEVCDDWVIGHIKPYLTFT